MYYIVLRMFYVFNVQYALHIYYTVFHILYCITDVYMYCLESVYFADLNFVLTVIILEINLKKLKNLPWFSEYNT